MHLDQEPPHQHQTGHRWFDIAMTVAILLVSVSSLIVAIVHSRTLERMADANARLVEANSWPFLSYYTGNSASGDAVNMSIVNDGVGPAKIEAIEVTWNNQGRIDAVDFLKACCAFTPKSADVEYELIAGRVLRAGQSINILKLPRTAADEAAWNALNRARLSPSLSVKVCYCSVFDECWTEDIVKFSLRPERVKQCTQPAIAYTVPKE